MKVIKKQFVRLTDTLKDHFGYDRGWQDGFKEGAEAARRMDGYAARVSEVGGFSPVPAIRTELLNAITKHKDNLSKVEKMLTHKPYFRKAEN